LVIVQGFFLIVIDWQSIVAVNSFNSFVFVGASFALASPAMRASVKVLDYSPFAFGAFF
jgi:hypothetical protein